MLKCYDENLQEDYNNKNHTKINLYSLIPESLAIPLESLVQKKALQFFLAPSERLSFLCNFITGLYKLLLLTLNTKLIRRPRHFRQKRRIKILQEVLSQLQGSWEFWMKHGNSSHLTICLS